MFSGTRDQVYQLTFTGVHDFSVRRQVDRGAVINVVLSGGVLIELRLSGDGCLVENDWISFVAVRGHRWGPFVLVLAPARSAEGLWSFRSFLDLKLHGSFFMIGVSARRV